MKSLLIIVFIFVPIEFDRRPKAQSQNILNLFALPILVIVIVINC